MPSVYPSIGRDWNHELAAFRVSSGLDGAVRRCFLVRSGTI